MQESDELELLLPTSLGVTCFRRRFGGGRDEDELARLNAQLVSGLAATEMGLISSTRLRGRYALRLCVLNHTTGESDVEARAELARAGGGRAGRRAGRGPGRRARPPSGRGVGAAGARPRWSRRLLAALPLFASLSDDQLERVARSARAISADPGQTIVRKWEASRDFYVLADGSAEVHGDAEHLTDLGPGDFFGELAALEWGAGFGYPRLATVIASSPVKAVVLSSDTLQRPDARGARAGTAGARRRARAPAAFLVA